MMRRAILDLFPGPLGIKDSDEVVDLAMENAGLTLKLYLFMPFADMGSHLIGILTLERPTNYNLLHKHKGYKGV